jgi:hypothetical protein
MVARLTSGVRVRTSAADQPRRSRIGITPDELSVVARFGRLDSAVVSQRQAVVNELSAPRACFRSLWFVNGCGRVESGY